LLLAGSQTNYTPVVSLVASNSFAGSLTITNLLCIGTGPWTLGASGNGVTVRLNGNLRLVGDFGVTNKPLTLDGGSTFSTEGNGVWAGSVVLNGQAELATLNPSTTSRVTGAISGPGGFTKLGPAILALSGASDNTYSGPTYVNEGELDLDKTSYYWAIGGGTLYIGDGVGGAYADVVRYTGASASEINSAVPIHLNHSGWLDLNGHTDDVGPIWLDSAFITTGTGVLEINGDVTAYNSTGTNWEPSIRGNVTLWSGDRTFNVTNSALLSVDASIKGGYGLRKAGVGSLRLGGSNAYTGLTLVQQGTLYPMTPYALGTTNSGTVVSNRAALILNDSDEGGGIKLTNETVTINADDSVPLLLRSVSFGLYNGASNRWAGPVVLNDQTLIVANNGSISGPITGPGSIALRGGTLYLTGSNANSFAGDVLISGGNLFLGKDSAGAFDGAIPHNLTISSRVVLGPPPGHDVITIPGAARLRDYNQIANSANVWVSSGCLLDLGGYYDRIGTLGGSGSVALGPLFLELSGAGTYAFDGAISGAGFLRNLGPGTLILTGTNTYTGPTLVADSVAGAGTIIVNGYQPQSRVALESAAASFGGSGTVGEIYCPGTLVPGGHPGVLTCSNLTLTPTATYSVTITGPAPGTGFDQLNVRGTNNLASASLSVVLALTNPITLGQQLVILNNDAAEPITGSFAGLPEGASLAIGGLGFKISYQAGDGNDVALTLVEVPVAPAGWAAAAGNGNAGLDPNECSDLKLFLTNRSGAPMSGISATLTSADPAVRVTQPFSTFPDLLPNHTATNVLPFQVALLPSFACGSNFGLNLTLVTASYGAFTIPVMLTSGEPAAAPLRFDMATVTNIPDVGTIESTNVVAGFGGPLMKIAVSLWITHALESHLSLSLIGPDGTTVPLVSGVGSGSHFGAGCSPDSNRTTFDDNAPTAIADGTPPFAGSFRPQGALAGLAGGPANGSWRLRVTDSAGGSLGALRCWSLFLYPAACAPGGGACALCPNVTITNSLAASTALQAGRLARDASVSSCGTSKAFPGMNDSVQRHFDAYPFYNGASSACITVTLASQNCELFSAAYLGSFNPANLALNYLADAGESVMGGEALYSFVAPANAVFVVTVNPITASLCGPYTLRVSGGDCLPLLAIAPAGSNRVDVSWPTVAGGYSLEASPALAGPAWNGVSNSPVANSNRFSVTNVVPAAGTRYYRLHRP
jgi:autotransporter-associated beta strand protein